MNMTWGKMLWNENVKKIVLFLDFKLKNPDKNDLFDFKPMFLSVLTS